MLSDNRIGTSFTQVFLPLMAERSEAKIAKRIFVTNFKIFNIFDAKLRFAKPFLALFVDKKMVILTVRVNQKPLKNFNTVDFNV